ncbi:MAG: AMP-binding protein [Clostridia bacterium]|nr:AMP-binding protein [Clostridia bacterium]
MDKANTLKELLTISERKYSKNTAFYLKDKGGAIYEVTYEKFRSDCESLGTALICELQAKGRNVAIFMANSYEWCVSYLAVAGGVGTVVPLDKELPCQELYNIAQFAEIDTVITDSYGYKVLSQDEEKKKSLKIITVGEEKYEDTHSFCQLLTKGEELLSSGRRAYLDAVTCPEEVAALLFTSGTTGMTKGVILTNSNLCSDIEAVKQSVSLREDDVSFSVLPLHHTYEAIAFLMIISSGAAISFCESFRRLRENFSEYRPTIFVTVPLLLENLHKRITMRMEEEGKGNAARLITKVSTVLPAESRKKIFSEIHGFFGGRLRLIICGAAALQKQTAKDFASYGIPVIIGYGLTECSPIVICNNDTSPTADTVGKPLAGVQVKIVNPDENGIGEIAVKGPMVMKGYYKNQAQTDKVIIDGWFYTGDLGFADKNGNYHITGRSKNVIVTANGKNIYPEELEYYLSKENVIGECVVCSESDDIICVEILPSIEDVKKKLRKENPTDEEIHSAVKEAVRAVNKNLPGYKRMRKVTIRKEAFEITTTHKIKR